MTISKNIFLSLLEHRKDENENRKNKQEAYCDLFVKAVKKYTSPRIDKYRKNISEGQCQVTITDLANTWKWQRRTVRCFLKELENAQALTRDKNLNYEILTLWKDEKAKPEQEDEQAAFRDAINDILSLWEGGHLQDYEAGEKIERLLSSEGREVSSFEEEKDDTHMGHDREQQVSQQLTINSELAETICLAALRKALRLFGDRTTADAQALINYFEKRSNHSYGNFLTVISEVALLLVDEKANIEEVTLWEEDIHLLLKPFRGVLGNSFDKQTYNNEQITNVLPGQKTSITR